MRRLIVLLLMVATAGCTSGSNPGDPVARTTASPSTSTISAGGVAACAPRALRRAIETFLSAYNAGAPDLVTRLIATPGRFQWFGQPDRPFPGPKATDLSSLQNYLLKRHRLGDHYALTKLRIADSTDSFGNRGFSIEMTLSGSIKPPHAYGGKGSITCDTGRLAVWLIYAGAAVH